MTFLFILGLAYLYFQGGEEKERNDNIDRIECDEARKKII